MVRRPHLRQQPLLLPLMTDSVLVTVVGIRVNEGNGWLWEPIYDSYP